MAPNQADNAASSEEILRREYQAEVGRLREAYERVRRERDEAREGIGCTCSQGYQRLRMALLAIADGRPMLEAQKLAIDALASVEEDLADAER